MFAHVLSVALILAAVAFIGRALIRPGAGVPRVANVVVARVRGARMGGGGVGDNTRILVTGIGGARIGGGALVRPTVIRCAGVQLLAGIKSSHAASVCGGAGVGLRTRVLSACVVWIANVVRELWRARVDAPGVARLAVRASRPRCGQAADEHPAADNYLRGLLEKIPSRHRRRR